MPRRLKGYACSVGPDGVIEHDTITCFHCNGVHFITPEDLGGHCLQCNKAICSKCADKGTCTPFLKEIEKSEAEQYRKNQNARILGI